jgi:hypothetical protein
VFQVEPEPQSADPEKKPGRVAGVTTWPGTLGLSYYGP